MPEKVETHLTTIEALIEKAWTCRDCGKVHTWRSFGPMQGGTWADPEDNHTYRPASRQAAQWLESLL